MSQNFNMSDDEREMQLQRSIIARQNCELSDLKKRLAQYESQCIPRTADMPEDAVGWLREVWKPEPEMDMPGGIECFWVFPSRIVGTFKPAPDLLPDEPGPMYRHIIDLE